MSDNNAKRIFMTEEEIVAETWFDKFKFWLAKAWYNLTEELLILKEKLTGDKD